jgi:sugar/nucleoside kinase (ribokinase family)
MGNKTFDAVVIGAAGVDTNIYLYGNDIDFNVEANFSENLDYVGQAGGYSARLFAQLGKRTAYIGAIGSDFCGNFILKEFARDNIDTSAVFIDPKGTKRSVNFMYKDGRRKNFYDGKGSMEIHPDMDKSRAVIAQSSVAHFSIVNWARELLPVARECGVIISTDIQDIVDPDDTYRQDFIENSDILFFSSVNFPDPSALIRRFQQNNPDRVVVCGMGERGCAVSEGLNREIRFFPVVDMDLPVIDTNGAGDSLAVGFLVSRFLDNYGVEDAITRAQIVARYTCSVKASTSDLITMPQLDGYFAEVG